MSRTRKSVWSVANGLIFTLVSFIIGTAATPLLLHWLGRERFGTYRVLIDWFGYIGLLELGLGGALMARLAVAIGRADDAATRSLLVSGIRAYLCVMALMLGFGLVWVASLPKLVLTENVVPSELRIAGLILLIGSMFIPLSVFRALIEARQQAYLISLLLVGQSIFMTALLVTTAWAGWGLIGQSAITVLSQIPVTLFLAWKGLRAYPGILQERAQSETTKKLWALNWPTFVFNISGRVGLLTDNIIIGLFVGPVAVVPFFLTQRLATIVLGQIQGIGNSTWAGLVELHSQGKAEIFRARLLELTSLVSGLGICMLGTVASYNHYFIDRWVGEGNYAGEAVTIIACVNIWLWAVYGLWGWPVSGTGNIGMWVPYAVAFATINILVSVAATFAVGIIGPLIGTLTAFIFINSWAMPRVLSQIFRFSPWELWRAALAPFVWGLPYVLILWLVARSHKPMGWLGLLIEMALAGLAGLMLWWKMSLSKSERTLWVARVQGAFGR